MKKGLLVIFVGLLMALVAVCHQSEAAEIEIFNFKFGEMDSGEKIVVVRETSQLMVLSAPDRKNYFGCTFDYAGNFPSQKLTTILQLPGKPKKDLGVNYHPDANIVKKIYSPDFKYGKFGMKWNFSENDLTGKFTLHIFAGYRLLKIVKFEVAEQVVFAKKAPTKVAPQKEATPVKVEQKKKH